MLNGLTTLLSLSQRKKWTKPTNESTTQDDTEEKEINALQINNTPHSFIGKEMDKVIQNITRNNCVINVK